MTYPTIMPALTLDFQNSKQLDPRVTFNREQSSGQATYTNSRGEVVYAYAHEPRFEAEGLLLEEQRTNLFDESENLEAWSSSLWTKANNQAISPDGTLNAASLVPNVGTNSQCSGRSVTHAQPGEYTCSVFVKSKGLTKLKMRFSGSSYQAFFDLTGDGSVIQDQDGTADILKYPNGWYKCIFTINDTVGETAEWQLGQSNDTPIDGINGFYVWGMQVEEGFPTSYIPTSGTALTRAPDIARVDMSDVITTTGPFTLINRPFGCSSGSDTLYLYGYPHIQSVSVYDGNLSQEEINSIAPKEDDFWRWRVLGSSWEINPTMSGDVTVDWGDGTIEPLQGARINHTFTNGGGYHEVGFRLDSGDWFSVNLNYTGAAEREKAVAVGPMPVGMATTGYYSYNYASNIKAWDAYLIHTYGGPNPHQLGRTYAGLSSLGSFPFTILDSRITSLSQAFKDCTSLQFFPLIDTSSILNFDNAWKNCRSLTSFPLIDTSSGTRFKNTWQSCITLTFFPFIDTSKATELQGAWYGCTGLTSFPLINTSLVENFQQTWYRCPNLTSFPLLDTSSGVNFSYAWSECSNLTSFPLLDTSSSGNFSSAWQGCSGLTSFPLLDTSSGTDFTSTWDQCSNLTSFPLLDTSSGTNFLRTWQYCSNLTSFPLIDTSSGEKLQAAWQGCSNLTSFPAGFFDSWSPSNVSAQCFYNTWNGCTSLTPASVSNILDSLAVAGVAAPTGTGTNDKRITIDWDGTGDPATASAAAITTLQSLNWEIYLNGTLQP